MPVKKLIVIEYTVTKEMLAPERGLQVGDKFSHFYDEETGKFYRPKDGYTVTGDNLEELFCEVDAASPDAAAKEKGTAI